MKVKIKQFFAAFDREYCRTYIQTHCVDDYQQIKRRMNRLLDNRFVFDRTWDMEPCLVEYQLKVMDWTAVFGEDPEWGYVLNRQEYLFDFLVGYLVEENPDYIDKLKDYLFHWIEQVTVFSPNAVTTRTLDTGIRCLTWVKIIIFLMEWGLLSEQELAILCQSLQKQIDFLMVHYREKYTLSNWGLLQTTAIIVCHYYLADKLDIDDAYLFSTQELERQLNTQVFADGTQFEQSLLYHVEVYKVIFELAVLVPDMKEDLTPLLAKMAHYIRSMTTPSGKTVAFGDSDEHHTADLLHASAVLLNDATLLVNPEHLEIYGVMLFGKQGIETFEALKNDYHEKMSVAAFYPDSGHVCIREKDSYLFFKNGPMGSAHTHSDQNSFCLYVDNRPVLIDSGRYTYKEVPLRYLLKSAASHSTCLIDDTPPDDTTGSWDYAAYPQTLYCDYRRDGQYHYIEGAYLSMRHQHLAVHKRHIIAISNSVWLVLDDVLCEGKHQLTTQFILDDAVDYQDSAVATLNVMSEVPLAAEPTRISKQYNTLIDSQKLVKRQSFENRIIDYTLFAKDRVAIQQKEVYQSDGTLLANGLAFEVTGPGCHLLIMLAVEDIYKGEKLLVVDGIKLKGKCIIYDKITKKIHRLKS
ncbi:alginate lyase family protein [Tuanshanicoccus lijuaniae]|uniref:alginate lyase family protein n=1 Tax=Aerococcaceae bacterium zg-1292 TaxID=2774330 RepID=UPI001935BB7D|nr:alginate lyase family protein [Aerococcaceae bacterium zg-1292]QQA37119.1 alginate lyase family protein [Aerococcaceae bacterium zg-1292]